jgi:hypothetical protein
MIYVQLCWLGTVGGNWQLCFITTECINEVNVFGSLFLNSVFVIISSLNETVIEHALLPIDRAVIYECQSGLLSIIDTVKARTML